MSLLCPKPLLHEVNPEHKQNHNGDENPHQVRAHETLLFRFLGCDGSEKDCRDKNLNGPGAGRMENLWVPAGIGSTGSHHADSRDGEWSFRKAAAASRARAAISRLLGFSTTPSSKLTSKSRQS